MKCIHESDVILAVGTRMNPFATLEQYGFDYWPKNAQIIQIEIDPRRLGLTKDCDVYINDDQLSSRPSLEHRLSSDPRQMLINR